MVPGTYADRLEITTLMKGMAQGGGGLFEMVQDFADQETEFEWIGKLSKAFGIPVSFGLGPASAKGMHKFLKFLDDVNADDPARNLVTGQVAAKAQGLLQKLESQWHPFVGHPTYMKELVHLPVEERRARMRDPAMKAQLLSETGIFEGAPFASLVFAPEKLYVLNKGGGGVPNYEPDPATESMKVKADAAGVHYLDMVYDALVGDQTLWSPIGRYVNDGEAGVGPLAMPHALLTHPHTIVALGDGGAHLTIFQEASCTTYMLSHWARDRTKGPKIPLESVVKKQTYDNAKLLGLSDRGVIQPGLRADLNVIDFEKLQLRMPTAETDLPTGAKRWFQKADGYVMTMVQGVPTFRQGKETGALPGRLVRNPLLNKLNVTVSDIDVSTVPEPHSTGDVFIADEKVKWPQFALQRAKKNIETTSSIGEFLTGRMLKGDRANTATSKL